MDSIADKINKPIVFVGMMGSGKSTIGSVFSGRIGIQFYDVDDVIISEQGRSISNIFESEGEPAFREIEKNTILGLLDVGCCLISTGGGAVITPEVLDAIKERSVSIWLKADVDELFKRVAGDVQRPLLQGDNPAEALAELLEKREPYYAQADIHIETLGKGIDDVIAQIEQELARVI